MFRSIKGSSSVLDYLERKRGHLFFSLKHDFCCFVTDCIKDK